MGRRKLIWQGSASMPKGKQGDRPVKRPRATPESVVQAPREYRCTQCGGDAFMGYSAGTGRHSDWGGRVKKGERLCRPCFARRPERISAAG